MVEDKANQGKATWSVLAVYEDVLAREMAMSFCDHLVQRFWAKFGFEVNWWPFNLLENPRSATEAGEKALSADLIIIATHREGELPLSIKTWIEGWLTRRGDREGALVGLMDPAASFDSQTSKDVYLRHIAHRAGMDYLTQLPQQIAHCIPDSLESFAERAQQVTHVLDEILHQRTSTPETLANLLRSR